MEPPVFTPPMPKRSERFTQTSNQKKVRKPNAAAANPLRSRELSSLTHSIKSWFSKQGVVLSGSGQ